MCQLLLLHPTIIAGAGPGVDDALKGAHFAFERLRAIFTESETQLLPNAFFSVSQIAEFYAGSQKLQNQLHRLRNSVEFEAFMGLLRSDNNLVLIAIFEIALLMNRKTVLPFYKIKLLAVNSLHTNFFVLTLCTDSYSPI